MKNWDCTTRFNIEKAIMDIENWNIDRENYGMLSTYKVNFNSNRILHEYGVQIEGNNVLVNGVIMYKIIRRYSTVKRQGMYKQLKPQLQEYKAD